MRTRKMKRSEEQLMSQSEDESSQSAQEKETKKRSKKQRSEEKFYYFEVPKTWNDRDYETITRGARSAAKELGLEITNLGYGPIKKLKSQKEKDENRRQYRKEYMTRPKVQAKLKERLADPEVIKKRALYANREETKQRKKDLSSYSRKIRRELIKNNPELYDEYLNKILEEKEEKKGVSVKDKPFQNWPSGEICGTR